MSADSANACLDKVELLAQHLEWWDHFTSKPKVSADSPYSTEQAAALVVAPLTKVIDQETSYVPSQPALV